VGSPSKRCFGPPRRQLRRRCWWPTRAAASRARPARRSRSPLSPSWSIRATIGSQASPSRSWQRRAEEASMACRARPSRPTPMAARSPRSLSARTSGSKTTGWKPPSPATRDSRSRSSPRPWSQAPLQNEHQRRHPRQQRRTRARRDGRHQWHDPLRAFQRPGPVHPQARARGNSADGRRWHDGDALRLMGEPGFHAYDGLRPGQHDRHAHPAPPDGPHECGGGGHQLRWHDYAARLSRLQP